jgi:DNA-binding winged helix-turn-helix (wHTH) protein/dipeptidyl aminopeptidase/acylaminoacyl peptidase
MRISFGPFAFDPQSRLLWRDGTEIALPPRVLGVLEALIERAGQVVARQDLLDRVWKDAFVTDTSLAEAVSFLRQALGDDPQAPRYIQTVHRRGYRFLVTPEYDAGQPAVGPGSDHLRSSSTPEPRVADPSPTVDWQLVPWSVAALCAGLAIAAVWHDASRRPPDPPPAARLELRATPGTTFDRAPQPIALAPDGRSIAWSACETASGRCAVYVRALDRLEARALPGTDDGHSPVFSPDGRWIAFFADGSLKKIASAGGAATTIAPAPDPGGAAWAADGRLAFAPSAASGLWTVDDEGGAPQPLTQPAAEHGELRHRFPAWIAAPEGGGLVFTVAFDPDPSTTGTLAAYRGGAADIHPLRGGIRRAAPAGLSYLLLGTATDLQAATFDERALVLTGATDSVPAPAGDATPEFAAAADTLAIVRPAAREQWTWSDGADASALVRFTSLAIAPDSTRAAGVDGGGDVWIVDLASGAPTRVTFGGGHVSPAWSADGSRVFFSSRRGTGPFHVESRTASDRNEVPAPLAGAPPQAFPTSAAADGRVALTIYKDGHTAVAIAPPGGGAPRVLSDGPFDETAAAFSPDGRWLAIESTASGRRDIVIRSASDGRRIAVSQDGGARPSWRNDGHAIYFASGRRILEAAFAPDGPTPRPLPVLDRAGVRAIVVGPSGRVLIARGADSDTALVALQWLRELRERLPLPVNTPR